MTNESMNNELAWKIQYDAFAAAGGLYDERHAKLYADLARDLIEKGSFSIIHEEVAHACYTPMNIDEAPSLKAFVLGPLAVLPQHQGQGYATRLMEEAEKQLDADAIFVAGDPRHYGRRYDTPHQVGFPVKTAAPSDCWFSKALTPGCLDGIVSASSMTGPYADEKLWQHPSEQFPPQ